MKIAGSGRLEEIDVLRGLAALCVVLSHYLSYSARYLGYGGMHLEHYGYYAVHLFFMISGFVIYWSLEKSGSWRDFAFSRAARLYPTYWAALLLMVLAETVLFQNRMTPGQEPGKIWLIGVVANATMLQEFLGIGNLDNVYWSLTVEIAFYAWMALLLALGVLRRIELIAALWLALACVWSAVARPDSLTPDDLLSRYLLFPYAPFFAAGIMFYLIHARGATFARIALILAALATEGWMHGMTRFGIAAVLFAIFGLAVTGGLRFLISPPLLWLGAISYPLYLSHRNLGYSTLLWLDERGLPVWAVLGVTAAGALLLATLLSHAVERPSLRTLRRWYGLRVAAPVSSGARAGI